MGWGYWPEARRGEIFPNRYESTTRKEKEREEERERELDSSLEFVVRIRRFVWRRINSLRDKGVDRFYCNSVSYLRANLATDRRENYFRYCCIIGDTIDKVEGIFVSSETWRERRRTLIGWYEVILGARSGIRSNRSRPILSRKREGKKKGKKMAITSVSLGIGWSRW